jgi:hypothetical protein
MMLKLINLAYLRIAASLLARNSYVLNVMTEYRMLVQEY